MRYLLIFGKTDSRNFAAGEINEMAGKSTLGGVLARFRYSDD